MVFTTGMPIISYSKSVSFFPTSYTNKTYVSPYILPEAETDFVHTVLLALILVPYAIRMLFVLKYEVAFHAFHRIL